jgi:hypothetical protein
MEPSSAGQDAVNELRVHELLSDSKITRLPRNEELVETEIAVSVFCNKIRALIQKGFLVHMSGAE